jgi:hypothetical protein
LNKPIITLRRRAGASTIRIKFRILDQQHFAASLIEALLFKDLD